MNDDVLGIPVGSTLQLQAAGLERAPRFNVRLIGYLPGASLLVTSPTIGGRLQMVRESQPFNVRMLRGNSVMGFVASVLQVYLKPYPHLHLEYPRRVESIMVRSARRAAAGIFALARNIDDVDLPENRHEVTMLDLSATGAKLSMTSPIAVVGDTLHLDFSLQVAGREETLAMLGEVRNQMVREDPEGMRPSYICGVQFRAPNRLQELLLHGWVLERLVAAAHAES